LKEGTDFFSTSTPPISSVIPAMDTIDRCFATASMDDARFPLPLKVALDLGKRIMNKYYDLTDESEIYRVSISKFNTPFLLVPG
jgi:hypothetical protein